MDETEGGETMKLLFAVMILCCVVGAANAASIIQNGSFENGLYVDGGSGFMTLDEDNAAITGWTTLSGGVDWVDSYWTAADGVRSLDMNGLFPGGIEQQFTVQANTTYVVSFDVAGNPEGGPQPKWLLAKTISGTGNTVFNVSFDSSGTTKSNMGWVKESFLFQSGNQTQATLRFLSKTNAYSGNPSYPFAFGPALDNVGVSAVPEPGSILAALTILGPVGLVFRRRRL